MGDSRKAIYEDEEEYEALCKRYGEAVVYKHGSTDCYGEHARKLKERRNEEYSNATLAQRTASKKSFLHENSMGKVSAPPIIGTTLKRRV